MAAQTIERLQQSLTEEKVSRSQVDGQMAALQLQMTSLKNEKEEVGERIDFKNSKSD
jgi:phage shock protein A